MESPWSCLDRRHRAARGAAPGREFRLGALLGMALGGLLVAAAAPAMAEAPIQLRIAGGLAGVPQFTRYEAPFWTETVPQLTQGRVHAEIAPFDQAGIRGQDMLALMRLGVVPFGTILLAVAASDEPELNGVDLPLLNPDIATLRQSVALWRDRLTSVLLDRYSVELLAIYAYPAQVIFCREAFATLDDLRGRRIRVSSVGQGEMLEALGAIPVMTAFAEIMPAMRAGVVACAVTGSLSGHALGLHAITTHVSRQAISWGISVFGASRPAWLALPPPVRDQLREGLAGLEEAILQAAGRETEDGFACNAGHPDCRQDRPGTMVVLDDTPRDHWRRDQLLRDTVLPAWIHRCGAECAEVWNRVIAPARGIIARAE